MSSHRMKRLTVHRIAYWMECWKTRGKIYEVPRACVDLIGGLCFGRWVYFGSLVSRASFDQTWCVYGWLRLTSNGLERL